MKGKDEYKDISDEKCNRLKRKYAHIRIISWAIVIGMVALSTLLSLTSCRSSQKLTTATIQKQDSTHTEVREKIVYVPDTVFFEIPAQTAERTTRDTTSFLENDYAESNARINPDGSLYHDLKTKPQKKPVPFNKPVERKDSIVYRNNYVEVPVVIEKELTTWQKFRLEWFGVLVMLLLALLAWTLRNPLKKLIGLVKRFV